MDTNLCGFYVLRHMINIIFEGRTEFIQKVNNNFIKFCWNKFSVLDFHILLTFVFIKSDVWSSWSLCWRRYWVHTFASVEVNFFLIFYDNIVNRQFILMDLCRFPSSANCLNYVVFWVWTVASKTEFGNSIFYVWLVSFKLVQMWRRMN